MQNEANAAADKASSIIAGKIPMRPQVPVPAIPVAAQRGHPEVIEGYIVAYYYAALTNLFCQTCLPPIPQAEHNDEVARAIMDASYSDFCALDSFLGALDPKEIQASPNFHLYREAREAWKLWVKDWTMISTRNAETS